MAGKFPLIKRIVMTGTPIALGATTEGLFDIELGAPNTNTADITISDGTLSMPMVPGEFHFFKNLDLSNLTADGTGPDVIEVIGQGAN